MESQAVSVRKRKSAHRRVAPLSKSASMARVRQRDTAPEITLRRALWAAGMRYRLHDKRLPGTPDIVFGRGRLVVFVHGCFWHCHGCPRSQRLPKANAEFWRVKLARNVERDAEAQSQLSDLGWRTAVVWQCEPIAPAVASIHEILSSSPRSTSAV